MKLVIARRMFADLLDDLPSDIHCVHNQTDEVWSRDELAAQVIDADALITTITEQVDHSLLRAAKRLRVVSNIAVGYNNIDVAACSARRIWVTNTPNVLTEATADHGFTIMLACAGRITEAERFVRAGHWRKWSLDLLLGQEVNGRTLGIIGMGRIGQAIARRARGFNMPVLYHSRRRLPDLQDEWSSKEELLQRADFVMLTAPYSAATHHMIDAAEIALMKPTAILVNIARGGVVNDAALIHALQTKKIAGAALDVFENEPNFDPRFLALDNVVLTPHMGSATYTTRRAMAKLALDNVLDALQGRVPRTTLNAAQLSRSNEPEM